MSVSSFVASCSSSLLANSALSLFDTSSLRRNGLKARYHGLVHLRRYRVVGVVYHYMSPRHLLRYVEEASFRWNNRTDKPQTLGRMSILLGNASGRHMPYRALTA